VIPKVLPLERIRAQIRDRAGQRYRREHGRTEQRRGVLGSKEVFKGTRIPVSSVIEFIESGADNERIRAAFPSLSDEDIDAARRRMRQAG
jgi:uncharacterized protein (DUF433 family)